MHQLPIEQQVLLVIEILALATLCLRLWLSGLHKVYVYFFSYLVLELLQTLIPLVVPLDSRLYLNSFVVSEALIVPVYALVVLELYSNVLRDRTGIAGLARRYIKFTLAMATAIALLSLALVKPTATMTGYLYCFERTVMSGLSVFMLLVTIFLIYYPVPLGRNVIAYSMGYAVYFLVRAALSLMINVGHRWVRELSSTAMTVSVACLVFWVIALRADGESEKVVIGHHWNPADEQRLRAQLDAINASLLRAGGKY